jgi:outer membrane murein-binding lipoprotein Lpp
MHIDVAEAKPPYVQFELRAEEDRAASLAAGQYIPKDIPFAIITPAGSKDRIERKVEEWFDMLKGQVSEERFPEPWLRYYKEKFAAWMDGQTLPELGTPIKNWAVPTPAQRRQLTDINIHTVEQLAEANEEAIGRLGMGGRALVSRAKDWLQALNGSAGKLSAEMETLRQDNFRKDAQIEELISQVRTLAGQVEALSKVSPVSAEPPGKKV